MVTEVDSLPLSQSDAISARSPFWDKAELPEDLPKRLLQTYFESVSEAVPPLPIEQPSPLPLIPLFPYQAGQNHVVFPFTFETSEIPSD